MKKLFTIICVMAAAGCLPSYLGAGVLSGAADLVLGQSDFVSNGSTCSRTGLYAPAGVAVDVASGKIYVCDSNNNRVLWWNDTDSLTNGKAADGVLGQADFTSRGYGWTQTTMRNPVGVCVDVTGNLWVADMLNNRVLKYSVPISNGQAASLVLGQSSFTVIVGTCTQTGMNQPSGVSVDGAGNVWVVDNYNNRVLKYSVPISSGRAASLVLGQVNFNSKSQALSSAGLSGPWGICIDVSSNIWVSDANNGRILRYSNPLTNGQAADLVLGQADFTSFSVACTRAGMFSPHDICFDYSGDLWAADTQNNRVLAFAYPGLNAQAASLAVGQPDFTNKDIASTRSGMDQPCGASVDALGNLWVTDTANNRILKFNTILASTVTPNANANVGPVKVNITGQEFVNGMALRLRKTGQDDILATDVNVLDSAHLTCSFDLSFKTTGYWDIIVSSGGTGSLTTVFANAFQITVPPTTSTDVYATDDSSVTLHADYGDIVVNMPPGTFSDTVRVTVSEAHVDRSDRSAITMSGISFEISASGNPQPAKAITITVHYRNEDIIGIDPAKLVMAYYDDVNARWVTVPSMVYPGRNEVVGTTKHLGKFAVVQLTPLGDLRVVKAYPNPFNPNRTAFMTIDNLTDNAEIKIFNITGELIRKIDYINETGRATWDGRNDSGNRVVSGVYLMFIKSPNDKKILKVAVEK